MFDSAIGQLYVRHLYAERIPGGPMAVAKVMMANSKLPREKLKSDPVHYQIFTNCMSVKGYQKEWP